MSPRYSSGASFQTKRVKRGLEENEAEVRGASLLEKKCAVRVWSLARERESEAERDIARGYIVSVLPSPLSVKVSPKRPKLAGVTQENRGKNTYVLTTDCHLNWRDLKLEARTPKLDRSAVSLAESGVAL